MMGAIISEWVGGIVGIRTQRYLTDVLTKLANQWPNSRVSELLPWVWKTQNAGAA